MNMSRRYFAAAGAFLLLGLFALPAEAQQRFSSGYTRPSTNARQNALSSPTVSPYLNLLRGSGGGIASPGAYQSLVRPMINQQNAIRQQEGQIRSLQQQQQMGRSSTVGAAEGLRGTGHQTFFMNFSHFFAMPTQ